MASNSPRLPSRRSILATVAISAVAAVMVSLSSPASLRIDGQRMISDVPPVTTPKGEVFVPLRVVAETLGAETNYDPKTGMIELTRADDKIATLNGNRMTLKHAPFSVRGRTMVSLSVIGRAFNTKVHYDGARAKIDVMTPGLIEAGAQEDQP
jgi:hypothetical protein